MNRFGGRTVGVFIGIEFYNFGGGAAEVVREDFVGEDGRVGFHLFDFGADVVAWIVGD